MYKITAFFTAALILSVSGGFADQHSILDFINAFFHSPMVPIRLEWSFLISECQEVLWQLYQERR